MGAFIIKRGGKASDGGSGEIVTGTFVAGSDTRKSIIVPDLIGKSRFVIVADHQATNNIAVNAFIRYIDGEIVQYDKKSYTFTKRTYLAGSAESAAYFDPTTGTLNPYAVNSVNWANSDYYTYYYTIFG